VRPSGVRTAWARRIYPDPAPFESAEESARLIHADVMRMEPTQLNRELRLARLRALADDEPSDWLRERLREVQVALAKPHRNRR
jgi:hypothetical protein